MQKLHAITLFFVDSGAAAQRLYLTRHLFVRKFGIDALEMRE